MMLKIKERAYSRDAIIKFLGYPIEDKEVFLADVCVAHSAGTTVYSGTPCVVEPEIYPNNEDSYSIDIWWSQAESRIGNRPQTGFPPDPYKSYFDYFHYDRKQAYIYFSSRWKEEMKIFILRRPSTGNNEEKIQKIIQLFE